MESPKHRATERSGSEPHVHFTAADGEDVLPPPHQVDVVASGDVIAIHAGFLKALHQYRITCRVPVACHDWQPAEVPALHWRVQASRQIDDATTELTLQVVAHKEKLLREKLVLKKADASGDSVTLELNARILGKDTGTPFLRDGVHLVGVVKDDEGSEAGSDWQGFD